MNPETFFAYATHHSESIIQWVFLAVLLMAGFLIARHLFGKKEAETATVAAGAMDGLLTAGPSPELQAMLTKIMEQTTKLESLNLKDMPAADVAAIDAQVQVLKKDLAAREAELTTLKAAGSTKSSDDAAGLSSRIKELEAKLSEYEILEDDIADLSLYKEENLRLRGELEKARTGGAAAAPAPAAEPAAPVVTPAPAPPAAADPGEAIVAEFASAIDAPMEPPAPVAAAPAPAPPPVASIPASVGAIPDTGDPMADFESTVNLERKMTGQAPVPAAVAESKPAAGGPPAEADDLFAEFATPAPDLDSNLGGASLDTDKMMAEMAALVGGEHTNDNALEESIDIEKMAAEAGRPHKS